MHLFLEILLTECSIMLDEQNIYLSKNLQEVPVLTFYAFPTGYSMQN